MSDNNKSSLTSTSSDSETEIARKQTLLVHNSWRDMDREIFEEMGVSMLVPEAEISNVQSKGSACKRKWDIENVNPNVNSMEASQAKHIRKLSPKKQCSPIAEPSKVKSPGSSERISQLLQPSDSLECTLIQPCSVLDEETPLPQHPVNSAYVDSSGYAITPSSRARQSRRPCTPCTPRSLLADHKYCKEDDCGNDAFSMVSDEVVLNIFKWLPRRTLTQCMLVCKRWHRVACDEVFWQRLELSNRVLLNGAVGKILSRQPIVVRLAGAEIGDWSSSTGVNDPSRIKYLDLSFCTISLTTLNCLLEKCPSLKKLSLELITVDENSCRHIGKSSRLDTLNLTMASGITSLGLSRILEGCPMLQSLNMSWCSLTTASLQTFCSLVPSRMLKLNLAGAKTMTSEMVAKLVGRCPLLTELDLSDCSKLDMEAVTAVMKLKSLEYLALSRCYLMPPHVLTELGNMESLQSLEVWGMLTTGSLAALRVALRKININNHMHSAIARPTVGTRRTSVWGIRTRD